MILCPVYHERITACLSQSEELGIKGCINLPTLVLSKQAKQKWIQFLINKWLL